MNMTAISQPGFAAAPDVIVRRQTFSGRIAMTLAVLALAALALMPWWATTGTIRMLLELCCYIAVAQMWNLLAGYAGLVSVGQQAFMGAAATGFSCSPRPSG